MDAAPATNPKILRKTVSGCPFSTTALRKILLPGLSRVWKHFPKNRFTPSLPPSPTYCPLHPDSPTSVLNFASMTTFADRVSADPTPTPMPSPIHNDPGRGNNNSYVVVVQGTSKCKKRSRTNLASAGEKDGGLKGGFSLKLGRATRRNLKFKRRLAQTLNTLASPPETPPNFSMNETEMILTSEPEHNFTPALWNKYHSLDTACGLIVASPTTTTITEPCPRPATPTHTTNLELLMDARTLAFEPGDNRACPKYVDTFGWDEHHKSPNIAVSRGIAKRHPVAMSTDAVRGAIGLGRGLHVWRVDWPLHHRGTQAVVGVILEPRPNSTPTTVAYRTDGYRPLVGARPDSWGWDLVTGRLYDGDMQHEPPNAAAGTLKTADLYPQIDTPCPNGGEAQVYVVLERGPNSGTLGYWSQGGGGYMGHAFRSPALKAVTTQKSDPQNSVGLVYPIVSAVWGHCEMQLHYVDGIEDGPLSLKLLSRFVIRKKTPFLANIRTRSPDLKAAQCQIHVPRQLLQYLLA